MSQSLLNILADFTVQLSTPVAIGDTTATLTSATDDDGVALPTGLYGLTIDAGQSNKEYITCTLTGTALTNIKSISRQGVETTGFTKAHRRGAKVTITDWAVLSKMFKNLNGDTGFNSSAPLFYDGAANITTANQLATKKYVDDVAIAGAGNADTSTQGLVQMATQSQMDAGTTQGSSGAYLVAPLDVVRAKKYHDYAADAGGTDAYAITITPAITAYSAGQEFTFKANTANTGAATLNVSGLGAKTIKKNYNEDLVTGDILANQIVKVVYDGTNMQLISTTSGLGKSTTTEIFSADGTWTKPTGAKIIRVICVGAGGGGGGGSSRSSGLQRAGGSGGGGGARTERVFDVSYLPTTVSVTVPAGGTGGGGDASGTSGGSASFGNYLIAYGGGAGVNNASTAATGGSGGGTAGQGQTGSTSNISGGSPSSAAVSGVSGQGAGATTSGALSAEWGGGSGGFIDSSNTPGAGGKSLYGAAAGVAGFAGAAGVAGLTGVAGVVVTGVPLSSSMT